MMKIGSTLKCDKCGKTIDIGNGRHIGDTYVQLGWRSVFTGIETKNGKSVKQFKHLCDKCNKPKQCDLKLFEDDNCRDSLLGVIDNLTKENIELKRKLQNIKDMCCE